MTVPSPLSCERVRDLLAEYVCDELPAEWSAEVRTHTETCARCRAEAGGFARVLDLAVALPVAEPSDAVSERILLAAREAAANRAAKAALEPKEGRLSAWWTRLSAWAFSPQVAMASVLLLMVGMGLYALPLGRQSTQLALEAVPEDQALPAPGAASAALAPSQAAEEEERAPSPMAEELERKGGDGLGYAEPQRNAARRASGAASGAERAKLRQEEPARAFAKKEASHSAADEALAARPKASSSGSRPESAASRSAAPSPFPAAEMAETAEMKASGGARMASALKEGIEAVERAAYAQAIALLEPVASQGSASERSSAQLWLARAYRGQGRYAKAAEYYELVLRSPNFPRAALGEAADCFEQLGNPSRALQLRQQMAGSN